MLRCLGRGLPPWLVLLSALGCTGSLEGGTPGQLGPAGPGGAGSPGGPGTDPATPLGPDGKPLGPPPPTVVRRLTNTEYNNTVRDLLGDTTRPADAFLVDEK